MPSSDTPTSDTPRLALLDRDGTLIDVVRDEETGTITTAFHPNQLRLLEGVVEGLTALVEAGYLLAIVTGLGPHGVFVAVTVAYCTQTVVALVLFKRGLWKAKRI